MALTLPPRPASASIDEQLRWMDQIRDALASQFGAGIAFEEEICLACSDETTDITTGTAKLTFRLPACTLLSARASLSTASSSGAPAIDINDDGVSIFSTTLTIDANEKTSVTAATPYVFASTSVGADSEMTVDIDTAGTGAKGLKVYLRVRWA